MIMKTVNAAISKYLDLWWDEDKAEAIKAKYGNETLSFVKEIYDYAVNYPVDWSSETYAAAIDKVRDSVKQNYPYLDENSVRIIGICFAYSWK